MTSHCSDNLYALMTFQGQELRMYVKGWLYGLSHNGRLVFSIKLKPSGNSKLVIHVMAHLAG